MASHTIAVWLMHPDTHFLAFSDENAARLRREAPEADVRHCRDEAEFLAALPEAEIALVWRFEQEWLPSASRLKWLVTPAAGKDYFHVDPPPGLELSYCSFHGELMAESALAMLFAEWRGVRGLLQSDHPWPKAAVANTMRPLRGSRLVILGFGHIGAWVGRLAVGLGMRVTGVKRSPSAPPEWFTDTDRMATISELDSILPEADALLLILPASPETDDILDGRRLDLLPPHAVVCNIGRGNAIDEDALALRLRDGRLRAAWLDVFREEPLPETSPLRDCPNAVLSPHISAAGPNYMDLFLDEFIPRYRRWNGA